MNQFSSVFFPPTTHGGHVHLATDRLLVYADVASSVEAHELWQSAVDALQTAVLRIQFESGAQFEECVKESLLDPLREQISNVACVLLQADAVYACTFGEGEVYVGRRKSVVPLLIQPTYAVGRVLVGDVFLLTAKSHTDAMTVQSWRSVLMSGHAEVVDDVSVVQDALHTLATQGTHVRALVGQVFFEQSAEVVPVIEDTIPVAKPPEPVSARPPAVSSLKTKVAKLTQLPKKRVLLLLLMGGLLLILGIGLAGKLRQQSQSAQSQKIAVVREYVEQQIALARGVASINNARARTLLQDASASTAELEKSLGADNSDVKALREELKKSQAEITDDSRKANEYFDLTIEQKDAKGTLMAQDGNSVAILDPAGFIYVVDLEDKSLDRRRLSNASETVSLSILDDVVYVLIPERGVAALASDGSSKKVISRSKNWSRPTQIVAYGSNIYILDSSAGQIFRYASTEKGYEESEYFRSKADLNGAGAMAIDGSIYIGFSSSILKFTSGLQDGFNPQFGGDKIAIQSMATSADLDGLYIWDQTQGQVQVLGKNGAFQQQVANDVLKKASAIAIFDNAVMALVDSKIYRIDVVQ